jgi:hypothetical protein
MNIINLTPAQLRQAADLKERIASLTRELTAILGGSAAPLPIQPIKPVVVKKGGMSAAGKAKIAAAQKLRWAKIKGAKAKPASVTKPAAKAVVAVKPAVKAVGVAKPAPKKGKISPEGMARIIAATKARWAKVRATKAAKKK